MNIELHKYNCCDFHNVDSIGVMCRGVSLGKIGKYKDNFKNVFVVGQHVESLQLIGQHIKGSNMVKVWGANFHKPGKEERKQCSEYNIKDLQTTLNPLISDRKAYKYRKIQKRYEGILETYPIPSNLREERNIRFLAKRKHGNGRITYPTLGLFAVDLASAYKPREIHIIGLDFYCTPYFTKEKNNVGMSSNLKRSPNMIEYFKLLCKEEKHIKYYLYTCCNTIKSKGNLEVIGL